MLSEVESVGMVSEKNAVCATAPLTDFRIFYYYIVLDRDLIQGGLNQN